jgi:hypothetical protein
MKSDFGRVMVDRPESENWYRRWPELTIEALVSPGCAKDPTLVGKAE